MGGDRTDTKQPEHDGLLIGGRGGDWCEDIEIEAVLAFGRRRPGRVIEVLLCPCLSHGKACAWSAGASGSVQDGGNSPVVS